VAGPDDRSPISYDVETAAFTRASVSGGSIESETELVKSRDVLMRTIARLKLVDLAEQEFAVVADLLKLFPNNPHAVLAAYNTGALNVDRAISRAGEANYWKIYPYIAQETRNYVPNILATVIIAKNPERWGFTAKAEPAIAYDIVNVNNAPAQ
jgi:hypothetical protein